MWNHLPEAVKRDVDNLAEGEIIDHALAKKIAVAYTWSLETVHFADTGEFLSPISGGRWETEPHKAMADALFHWWAEADPSQVAGDAERRVFAAMGAYLDKRFAAGDTGEVPGWGDLPER